MALFDKGYQALVRLTVAFTFECIEQIVKFPQPFPNQFVSFFGHSGNRGLVDDIHR